MSGSGRRLEALRVALRESPLCGAHQAVIFHLDAFADFATGENARPGLRTLAKHAGVNKGTAMRALLEAEKCGVIVATDRRKGYATTYAILAGGLSASEGHLSASEGQWDSQDATKNAPDVTPHAATVPIEGSDCPPTVRIEGTPLSASRAPTPEQTTDTPVVTNERLARAPAHPGAYARGGTNSRDEEKRQRRDLLGLVVRLVRAGDTACDCFPRPPHFATDPDGVSRCPTCFGIETGLIDDAHAAVGIAPANGAHDPDDF
jgi:hypothetical protein